MNKSMLNLKYGCNPHQKPASISINGSELPFKIVNDDIKLIQMVGGG